MDPSELRHRGAIAGRLAEVVLLAAWLPIGGAVLFVSASGPIAASGVASIAVLCAGGLAWLGALFLARRGAGRVSTVVAGAIALRLLALSSTAELSDDAYRSVWEGLVVLEGASPYAFAPADLGAEPIAALAREFPALHARVNHPEVPAAYPPVSQAFGVLAAAASRALDLAPERGGVGVLRVLYGACDLLVLVPLAVLLRRARLPGALVLAWGWCPWLALEFAGSAHHDALGVLCLLAALVGIRSGAGAAVWSAGVLVKLVPVALAPWILRGPGAGRRLAIAAGLAAAACAPFLFLRGGEAGLARGISDYAWRWESASLVHRWVEAAFDAGFARDGSWSDPRRLARAVAALAWIAYVATIAARVKDPVEGCARAIGAWLVLSPTLHPWYLAWIVPFLALRRSAAWTWLALAAPLLYWPVPRWQAERAWVEPGWLWPVLAVPFVALGLAGLRRRRAEVAPA